MIYKGKHKLISLTQFSGDAIDKVWAPFILNFMEPQVIEYLEYRYKYQNSETPAPMFDVDESVALELLTAASYLGLE